MIIDLCKILPISEKKNKHTFVKHNNIVRKDWSVSVFSHNEIAVKNVPTLIACTDICVYL